ncbi:uncharacterized protein [Nicotiana tomentosiformis]|uniref:uncharacterized protein n=1 Tax=Nicotiana tomentosiformis TaxID=4098 RepID=UPI00051AFFC5|nr:uncharacterized protein LOC104094495 [Nicotiana tomentosiformis]
MASLTVLLRHSGKWNSENNYVDYSIEGILIKEYATYNDLVASISKQLTIDLSSQSIKIEYKVEENCTLIEIHNDMGYRVYVELKKENREFGIYHLCITTMDKEVVAEDSLIQGDLMRIDETDGVSKFDTTDILALESVNSGEPIDVFELERDLIISKTNQREVMAGQVYKDKATLKAVMEHYAIAERFQFRIDKSNAIRFGGSNLQHFDQQVEKSVVVSVYISYPYITDQDCEWRFKASSNNKSQMFNVREFNDKHTCPLKNKVYEQRQVSSSLIGGMIRSKFTNDKRKYTPKDIIDAVKSDFGVDVSYMLARRAKEKAMNFLRGELADSYNKLPGYLYTLYMTYPGSHIRMGFDHGRPIVVVDGSHLKLAYTGTFVSASMLDGAGHIMPLAYGVVDSENDAAWSWFFEQFKEAYGERENMCIVSDRNESIIKSVSRVYPTIEKAYTQDEFDSLIEKVEKVDIRVKEYLELTGYEKWARLYALVNRGWTMTSNIAESINIALVSARELPIYDFLEEVRKMFGRWNCSNRKKTSHTYRTLGKNSRRCLL